MHQHDQERQERRDGERKPAGRKAESEAAAQSVATARILTKISELEGQNPGIDFTPLKETVLAEDTQSANEEAGTPGPLATDVPPQASTQASPTGDRQEHPRGSGRDSRGSGTPYDR
jgi:hypothetical protein